MPPQVGSLLLYVAGIAAVATLLRIVGSQAMTIDARIWLVIALVSMSLYLATLNFDAAG